MNVSPIELYSKNDTDIKVNGIIITNEKEINIVFEENIFKDGTQNFKFSYPSNTNMEYIVDDLLDNNSKKYQFAKVNNEVYELKIGGLDKPIIKHFVEVTDSELNFDEFIDLKMGGKNIKVSAFKFFKDEDKDKTIALMKKEFGFLAYKNQELKNIFGTDIKKLKLNEEEDKKLKKYLKQLKVKPLREELILNKESSIYKLGQDSGFITKLTTNGELKIYKNFIESELLYLNKKVKRYNANVLTGNLLNKLDFTDELLKIIENFKHEEPIKKQAETSIKKLFDELAINRQNDKLNLTNNDIRKISNFLVYEVIGDYSIGNEWKFNKIKNQLLDIKNGNNIQEYLTPTNYLNVEGNNINLLILYTENKRHTFSHAQKSKANQKLFDDTNKLHTSDLDNGVKLHQFMLSVDFKKFEDVFNIKIKEHDFKNEIKDEIIASKKPKSVRKTKAQQ